MEFKENSRISPQSRVEDILTPSTSQLFIVTAMRNKKSGVLSAGFFAADKDGMQLQRVDDVREDVTDGRPEQGEDDDNDDGDEHQDKSVFDQTLALFTR